MPAAAALSCNGKMQQEAEIARAPKNGADNKNGPADRPSETESDPGSGLERLAVSDKAVPHVGAGTRLRNHFLTGLVVAAPVSITIYITYWFVTLVDEWFKPLLPDKYNPETYLPFSIPGLGLLLAIVALTLLGALTANLFGRTIVSYSEEMVGRMPVVRNVYRALKQIFETVVSQSSSSFKQVGLIEYPRKGLYAIVFVSTETEGEITETTGATAGMLSVFLPTTPNPTSGYLLFVPRKDVMILEMSVEDAAKMVVSAGLVVPEYQSKLKAVARTRRRRTTKPSGAKLEPAD